jgi:hypothetical protein
MVSEVVDGVAEPALIVINERAIGIQSVSDKDHGRDV